MLSNSENLELIPVRGFLSIVLLMLTCFSRPVVDKTWEGIAELIGQIRQRFLE